MNKFSFIASSCAETMTESPSFNEMSLMKPDFFVNVGDLHYAGSDNNDKEEFIFAYHEVFKSSHQRAFYEEYPLVYTFDDHDVGSNNADGRTFSSGDVNQVYRVSIINIIIIVRILFLIINWKVVSQIEAYNRSSQLAQPCSYYLI